MTDWAEQKVAELKAELQQCSLLQGGKNIKLVARPKDAGLSSQENLAVAPTPPALGKNSGMTEFGIRTEAVSDPLDVPDREDREDREPYIRRLIELDYGRDKGPATIWAVYHITPLEVLGERIQFLERPGVMKGALIYAAASGTSYVLKKWLTNFKKSPYSDLGAYVPEPPSISDNAKQACLRRDNYKCILTGRSHPDVVPIYPLSLDGKDRCFWSMLEEIWGPKIEAWRNVVGIDPTGAKNSNLICLSPTFHKLWSEVKFAFKPISVHGNELRLQFFWLKNTQYKPDQMMSLLTKPDEILTEQSWHHLDSGTVFTVTADNPDDLPSFEILDMQWHLHRLAAMCGTLNADQEDFDNPPDPIGP